jgi:hypothetical protein
VILLHTSDRYGQTKHNHSKPHEQNLAVHSGLLGEDGSSLLPHKFWQSSTCPHSITTREATMEIFTAARTSNLIKFVSLNQTLASLHVTHHLIHHYVKFNMSFITLNNEIFSNIQRSLATRCFMLNKLLIINNCSKNNIVNINFIFTIISTRGITLRG